jgi:DNA-binding GntR family transcriptional regulator
MDESRYTLPGVQKIQRGPLREQVRAQIKQLILTNQLRPGQPIVIDRLASELGVSHTPVREALAMLQHDGLVVMRPYENPRVAEIAPSDVREAWEMRLLLEGWAINQAALRLPEEALDEMAGALTCARQEAEESRYEGHLESDFAMHEMILKATDNRLFARLAQLVNDQSVRIRWLVETIAAAEQVLAIIDEHCAILEALRARDQEMAYKRLIAHLEGGRDRTLRALEKLTAGRE